MSELEIVNVVKIFSDICVGLSALIVAVVSLLGLRQWRAELKGRAKFDLARQLSKTAIQFRNEARRVRDPVIYPQEKRERSKQASEERERLIQLLDEYFVRRNRLEPLQSSLERLNELGREAEVLLEEQIGEQIAAVNKWYKDLESAIDIYFRALIRGRSFEGNDLQEQRQIVYGTEDDEHTQRLYEIIGDLIKTLKHYMK